MTAARKTSLTIAVLSILALTGLAAGYFLPSGGPPVAPERHMKPGGVQYSATYIHEFPLTVWDIPDSVPAPTVAADDAENVYVAWASQTNEFDRSLLLVTSADGGRTFSTPREVTRSQIFSSVSTSKGKTVKRTVRMTPHVAVGSTLTLAWTESIHDNTAVRMVLAESTDRGQTFSSPTPVLESESGRPTFTAFAAGPDAAIACSWLDNRNKSQQVFASRRLSAGGFTPEVRVFAGQENKGVCPCCPTATAIADGEQYVAFRNQLDGYRDIWIARRSASADEFEPPVPVVAPTWQFDGCPHDGPSLAIVGENLHVTWMDASSGQPRVYYALGSRSEMKFAARPLHPEGNHSQGNARLAVDRNGAVHAVWESSLGDDPPATAHANHGDQPVALTGSGRAIMYAVAPHADGKFSPPRALAPRRGRFQTRPALACGPDGAVTVAWNEQDDSGRRIVIVRVDA